MVGPVYIDFGPEASWPLTSCADDDFVLPRGLVDVSDANVCHRVPLCRWHACLEPPGFVTFLFFFSDLKSSYFYDMDIMHWYRDRYI